MKKILSNQQDQKGKWTPNWVGPYVIKRAFSRRALILIEMCHNGFPLNLDDYKNKWSRHRSFLYGCDGSPELRIFKLGIEIPNLNTN